MHFYFYRIPYKFCIAFGIPCLTIIIKMCLIIFNIDYSKAKKKELNNNGGKYGTIDNNHLKFFTTYYTNTILYMTTIKYIIN